MRLLHRNLLRAARSGQVSQLARLLEQGAALNCADASGNTPLLLAAWGGHEAAVRFLLDAGADANARARDDATAVFAAAARKHPAIVAVLLERGADPNVCRDGAFELRPGDTPGWSPLQSAISHDDEVTARLLLEAGARTDNVRYGVDAIGAARERGLHELADYMRRRSRPA